MNSKAYKKVVGVDSDYDAPVNKGNLCIKGRYGYDFIHHKDRSQPGNVFMTFHHPDALTNILTSHHRDRIAGTPEYKSCAVRLEPAV